jgi:hypothetical protein
MSRTEKPWTLAPRAPISVGGVPVPVPGHLATFYSSDAARMRLTVPFLAEGLRSGQPCFLAATEDVLRVYRKALANHDGIDLKRAVSSGQFSAVGFDGADRGQGGRILGERVR